MSALSRDEAAERAGVGPEYVERLVDLGIVAPAEHDRFSTGDVRRVLMVRSLESAGIALGVATLGWGRHWYGFGR